MKTLKVLSIDFDFFQLVDKDTIRTMYPDGLDLDSSLTEFTWSSYYRPSNSVENKVKIDSESLDNLKTILNNQDKTLPVMIANSHKHIYKFILDNKKDCTKLDLVNIDMHHDMFNDNKNLDCGNWIKHIIEKFDKYNLTWIANKISKEVYGMGKEFSIIKTDFKEIENDSFDIIFICRSDTWLPPHLDEHFDNLYQFIINNFEDILVDKQIKKPRNLNLIKEIAAKHEEMNKEYINKEE